MPGKVSISFASSAVTDLEDLQAYYNSEDAPDAGKRPAGDIIIQIERLADHPFGAVVLCLNSMLSICGKLFFLLSGLFTDMTKREFVLSASGGVKDN